MTALASILRTLLLVTAAVGPLRAQDQAAAARPNIVFILSDDHRWDALGAAGNSRIRTPTLDRLARDGSYFRQATVFVSQCTPSRAVLMTGLPPHANGIYSIQAQHPDLWWRDHLSVPTLPSLLQEAGYHTVLVGKWHLAAEPWKAGFSEVRTLLDEGIASYRDPRLSGGNSRDRRRMEGFTNEIFVEDAVAFLATAEAKAKPFLLWLATTAPHGPMQPNPDSIVDLYRGRTTAELIPPGFPPAATPEDFLHYSQAVSLVDDMTRRVLEALVTHGLAGNTIVVFLGDNGHMMGSRGLSGKIVPYEESIRVPLIVRVPGDRARGTSEAAVSSLDLPPTLLRLARVDPPTSWPGRDMSALLRTGRDAEFDHAFAEWSDNESWFGPLAHRLVRTPELKLIR